MELSAARARAIGVAATGAIAVFGAVAIQGAHSDLLKGLENAAHDENAFTDLWVSAAWRLQPPEDRAVRAHRSGQARNVSPACGRYGLSRRAARLGRAQGMGDRPTRRSEATATRLTDRRRRRPRGVRPPARGRVGRALPSARLRTPPAYRRHGHHPEPVPTTVRVAALSTNIGWAPGAMTMSASDYAQAWGSTDAERIQRAARSRAPAKPRSPSRSGRRSGPPRAFRRRAHRHTPPNRTRSAVRACSALPRSRP